MRSLSKRFLLLAASGCLFLIAWTRPAIYPGRFQELAATVRAMGWLLALALGVRALAPARLHCAGVRAFAAFEGWLRRRHSRAFRLAVLLATVYVLVFAPFVLLRHERFNSSTYDLAVYDQAVWSTTQGRWLETSIEARPGEYMCLLADHFAPILTLLAPLYWLWPHVHALLLFQTAALAAGALCVFAIAEHRLQSRSTALAFAATYLLYPAIGFVNRFDFHPVALSIPLLLTGILCVERRRWGLAAICLGATMLCKEDMGLAVGTFALAVAFSIDKKALGCALFAAGVGASLLAMFVVLPAYRGAESDTWERYLHWGPTPGQAIANILSHPAAILQDIVHGSPHKAAFLLKVFLPVAFLSLLRPWPLLAALPALGYNLASGNPSQSSVCFHYVAPIVPFVFYAAILAAERIQRGRCKSHATLTLLLLACAVLAFALDCPFTKRITFPFWEVYGVERTCDANAIRAVAKHVPSHASLAATMPLGSHFSHRRNLRLIWPMKSSALPSTDYILADLSDYRWNSIPNAAAAKQNLALLLSQAVANGYGFVSQAGPVVLLKKDVRDPAASNRLMMLLDKYVGDELRVLRQKAPRPR